jgi:transcriptional regulator with XRE-family HTH domain
MSGKEVVKIIENELFLKDISKKEFYEACGLNSATLSNWRNGVFSPSPAKLQIIEQYLGISFEDYEKQDEADELRDLLRGRQDLRILLSSAKDVPASSVYALISQIEKLKEDST